MQNESTEVLAVLMDQSTVEENGESQPMDEIPIDPKLLALFPPGAEFPIWSPYDSDGAAAILLAALAEYEKKHKYDDHA